MTGFLGPNGAGKSTTLRMLLGLIQADRGTGTFGGRRYEELDRPSAHVGAVLENASLPPRAAPGATTCACSPPRASTRTSA